MKQQKPNLDLAKVIGQIASFENPDEIIAQLPHISDLIHRAATATAIAYVSGAIDGDDLNELMEHLRQCVEEALDIPADILPGGRFPQ